MTRTFSRRMFLRGAGGAALAIPFLPSLVGRAAPLVPPQGLVVFYLPNNDTLDFPVGPTGPFSLAGTYHEPLSPYADRMLVVNGLVGSDAGHNMGHTEVLSGHGHYQEWEPRGETLDQLAKRKLGTRSVHAVLASQAEISSADHSISMTQNGSLVIGRAEPIEIYNDVIASFPEPGSPSEPSEPSGPTPEQLAHSNLLDLVVEDYKRVRARVSPEDRRLLEAHLTVLEEMHTHLDSGGGPQVIADCSPPDKPQQQYNNTYWHTDPATTDAKARAHLDVIAASVTCGAASVATFMFGPAQGTSLNTQVKAICDNVSLPSGVTGDHEVAHYSFENQNARDAHFQVRQWQSQHIRYFLDRLATPMADGSTGLDNTMVVVLSELGILRPNANGHGRYDIGAIVVGSGANNYLRQNHRVHAGNADYGRFLFTLVQAMGFNDVTSFGFQGQLPSWNNSTIPSRGYGDETLSEMERG